MGQLPLAVKGPGFIPWPLGGCPILPQRLPCSKGPGPVQPLYALPAPGTEGAQQAPWHPHQQKAGLQLVGREGEDPEEAGPHAWSLSTSRAPCMAGQGCAHTLPPTGRSVARLSCSRPSCPPPAPVCSAAAAAGPAHPSPRQPGSAGRQGWGHALVGWASCPFIWSGYLGCPRLEPSCLQKRNRGFYPEAPGTGVLSPTFTPSLWTAASPQQGTLENLSPLPTPTGPQGRVPFSPSPEPALPPCHCLSFPLSQGIGLGTPPLPLGAPAAEAAGLERPLLCITFSS